MIKLTFNIMLLLSATLLNGQSFFDRADTFFATYVQDGLVDYARIQQEPEGLQVLVEEIATLNLANRRVTPDFLKAFYINAYNILVIEQVVMRYPIAGPLQVEGFFDAISHQVMGETMTLDQLEKKTLFAQFPDPRLHFVLVCAARGCPPLQSHSFKPEGLEEQLNQRTTEVLNLEWFIRVNKKQLEISKLFDWYRDDFISQNSNLIGYINQYRSDRIVIERSFEFYEYDWALNELK